MIEHPGADRDTRNREPESIPATFRDMNSEMFVLPRDILSSEARISELIHEIERAELPLDETYRLIAANQLVPFLTGSRLTDNINLLIDIADDLSSLTLSRIDNDLSEEQLNGLLDLSDVDASELARISNPNLVHSAIAIADATERPKAEEAAALFLVNKRLTRYRGVTVSWDPEIDRQVWTTNIDTVHMLNQLFEAGVLTDPAVRSMLEVGIGGGAMTKTAAAYLPNLQEITGTDISNYALMCAKRNIEPQLQADQILNLYSGKGVKTLSAQVDLVLVNPPYVPHPRKPDAVDPYRGTGLIREIINQGDRLLNPDNPNAAVYLGMSSLAERDLVEYLGQNPNAVIEQVGERKLVPLKIRKIQDNAEWIDHLTKECGLIVSPQSAAATGFEYWHEIYVLKLQFRD